MGVKAYLEGWFHLYSLFLHAISFTADRSGPQNTPYHPRGHLPASRLMPPRIHRRAEKIWPAIGRVQAEVGEKSNCLTGCCPPHEKSPKHGRIAGSVPY